MFVRRRLKSIVFPIIAVLLIWIFYNNYSTPPKLHQSLKIVQPRPIQESATTILRLRDDAYTIHMKDLYFKKALIIRDSFVKPNVAVRFPNQTVLQFVRIGVDLLNPTLFSDPLDLVTSTYVFLPVDLPEDLSREEMMSMVTSASMFPDTILVIPFKGKARPKCFSILLNLKEWTMERHASDSHTKICDYVEGSFALFMTTTVLRRLIDPLMHPFPEPLFIQAAAKGIKLRLFDEFLLTPGPQQVVDRRRLTMERIDMFSKLKIKKVILDDRIEWFGCSRNTTRCFGTVHNETPDYLMQGRWTPPCCLKILRETARYVFETLDKTGIRYWLEGGSLLGAMRTGDIIPWDYDVDVGAYRNDLIRCSWIRVLMEQMKKGVKFPRVIDKNGYVWETSRPEEGFFYRVQSSVQNRLHVDIFPFYSRGKTMTKDTWIKGHKQDMEFPEMYLKPLTKIDFVGTQASAPNNIRQFLELKFGAGCIENPQYPNPSIVPYPVSTTNASSN